MKKAKVAVIGLGGWGGTESLPALMETDNLELVTWYDANPDIIEQYRNEIPVPPTNSYEDILDNPEVQGVILIVPNHVHKPLTVKAAQKGKHVWIEKPIANTVAEADDMIKACEDAGVKLQVGHSLRRSNGMRKIKELMDSGKIGEIAMLEAHQSHRGGWSLTSEAWRWYNDKCPGGPLNLLGIHQIDNMHYLVGNGSEVMSLASKKCLECEIDEITQLIVRFENGILGYIGDTYITPGKTFIAVYGTIGRLEFDFLNNKLTHYDIDGKAEDIPVEPMNLITDQFREFGECILDGKAPETGGEEARAAVALLEAACESAKSGKSEKIQK